MHGFTLVQNASYALGGDVRFRRGVEARAVETLGQLRLVEQVGGLVFETRVQAENYAYLENYPPRYVGMTPIASGRFSTEALNEQRIYVPA